MLSLFSKQFAIAIQVPPSFINLSPLSQTVLHSNHNPSTTLFPINSTPVPKLPESISPNWDFLAIGGNKIELFNKFFAILFGKISRKRKEKNYLAEVEVSKNLRAI
jgi:hypothetical protein